MNITETFQAYALETTPADGSWIYVDASPTECRVNVIGRSSPLTLETARKLRAIINHFIEAETVTEASTAAAVAAEFEE